MGRSEVFVLLFLASVACSEKVSYRDYKIYDVTVRDREDANFLYHLAGKGSLDFWTQLRNSGDVSVIVAPEAEASIALKLKQHGMTLKLKHGDLQTLIDFAPMVEASQVKNDEHGMDWDNYHDLDTIYNWFEYLEATHDSVSVESIGQSLEGRDMRVIKICSGECGTKPAIFLEGALHAREWITPAVELTENAATYPRLVEKLDWYVLPVANPDGYAYSISDDRLWRKTRLPSNDSECVGTDANRNFDFQWSGVGSSSDPCSNNYHGPFAYSDIEVAHVRDFVDAHKEEIKFFNDVHSAASMALFPWAYSDESIPDAHNEWMEIFYRACEALTEVHGYPYEVGTFNHVLYPASGVSLDWGYHIMGIPYVLTMELRKDDGFTPPPSNIKLEGEEVWAFHRSVANDIIAEFSS